VQPSLHDAGKPGKIAANENLRAADRFGRAVVGGQVIEAEAGDEAGRIAGRSGIHFGLDLRLRPAGAPDPQLIYRPFELAVVLVELGSAADEQRCVWRTVMQCRTDAAGSGE